jgi:hypothetical protein
MAVALEVELARCLLDGKTFSDEDDFDFVAEVPQIYFGNRLRVDPDDLLQLTGVVGACTSLFPGMCYGYYPREWKKQIPKEIHHKRLVKVLSEQELKIWENIEGPSTAVHNARDAIGLGLYHLGRYTAHSIQQEHERLIKRGAIK